MVKTLINMTLLLYECLGKCVFLSTPFISLMAVCISLSRNRYIIECYCEETDEWEECVGVIANACNHLQYVSLKLMRDHGHGHHLS